MSHGHDHSGGHGHSHGVSADADSRKLALALGLLVAFMIGEVIAGLVAHSLALLSDAAHMLTDAGAITFSLVAIRLAARPARGAYTYGLKRAEILSAQLNGLTLLLLGAWILFEAVKRLIDPPDVEGGLVFATALVGVVINLAATFILARANRSSMNVEGAYQHILTDLYAFIGTLVAAVVIMTTGFDAADPIASVAVAALMLRSAYGLIRASGRVFLEAAPQGMDPEAIAATILAQPGVLRITDLHVWEVTSGFAALSAQVVLDDEEDCHGRRRKLTAVLQETYGIDHTTLQIDHAGDVAEEEQGCGQAPRDSPAHTI